MKSSLILLGLLNTVALADGYSDMDQPVCDSSSASPGAVTSRVFIQYNLGAGMGGSVRFNQVPTFSSTGVGLAPNFKRASFNGLSTGVHLGGDYLVPGSTVLLGGAFGYNFLWLRGKTTTAGTICSVKDRGHLDLLARIGIRANRWVFLTNMGVSWHFFSAKFEAVNSVGMLRFKNQRQGFFVLGFGPEYNLSSSLAIGGLFNMYFGRIKLTKCKGIGVGAAYANGASIKSSRARIFELLATVKYQISK
jgi:hypothetical protein